MDNTKAVKELLKNYKTVEVDGVKFEFKIFKAKDVADFHKKVVENKDAWTLNQVAMKCIAMCLDVSEEQAEELFMVSGWLKGDLSIKAMKATGLYEYLMPKDQDEDKDVDENFTE